MSDDLQGLQQDESADDRVGVAILLIAVGSLVLWGVLAGAVALLVWWLT